MTVLAARRARAIYWTYLVRAPDALLTTSGRWPTSREAREAALLHATAKGIALDTISALDVIEAA